MKLTIKNYKAIVGRVDSFWIVSNIEERDWCYEIKCTNRMNGKQRLLKLEREFDVEGGYRFIRADALYGIKSHPYTTQNISDIETFKAVLAYEIDYGWKPHLI